MLFYYFHAKKPDKYGITFWVCADVQTKHVVNIIPHLAVQKKRKTWTHIVGAISSQVFSTMCQKQRLQHKPVKPRGAGVFFARRGKI